MTAATHFTYEGNGGLRRLPSAEDPRGMPESDQHWVDEATALHSTTAFDADMGDVLLSDDMSFDAIAAEIRRTMSQTGSVLESLMEKKEKQCDV